MCVWHLVQEQKQLKYMATISKELQMLDDALMEIHDRIKSGRCLTNKQQVMQMNSFLRTLCNKDEGMSFAEACSYVQIRPSTFRKYVKEGKLPEGKKRKGFTEKFWYAKDLDKYIDELMV